MNNTCKDYKKISYHGQTARHNSVADLLITRPLHMCYYAKFGHTVLKDIGINTGEPQILGNTGTLLSSDGRSG